MPLNETENPKKIEVDNIYDFLKHPIKSPVKDAFPVSSPKIPIPPRVDEGKPVDITEGISVSWFELIKTNLYYYTVQQTLALMKGDTVKMEELKGFIIPMIVRWALKIGGGFLLSVGISAGSVTEIVTAIVTIGVGLAISLINHKTAIQTPPPAK